MNLLLAAALLLQDKTAEETFKRIEEPILKAKSISLDFKLLGEEGAHKWGGGGTLLLKEGNKVRFEWVVLAPSMVIIMTSDGEHVLRTPERRRTLHNAPQTLGLAYNASFCRLGVGAGGTLAMDYVDPKDGGIPNIPELLKISDLKQGEDDGALKTLTWTVTISSSFMPAVSKPVPVKLWYDPKTFKPVKRTLTNVKGDVEVNWMETYENVTYDEPIPDEKFKLPEVKK